MKRGPRTSFLITQCCALLIPLAVYAQIGVPYTIQSPFYKPFFMNSHELIPPIHIVHIGDSHLQSGFLSEQFRCSLSKSFTIMGYGLVTPYKLANSNAPIGYRITSSVSWNSCTLSYAQSCSPTPPGGVLLSRQGVQFSFTYSCSYSPFDRIIYYRGKNSPALIPEGVKYVLQKGHTLVEGMVSDTLFFSTPVRSVTLQPQTPPSPMLYYGGAMLLHSATQLSSNNPKALYSSVGINGAMYVNYDREEVLRSIAQLKPSIILVSLGTNESLARHFRKEPFKQQVKRFVIHCQQYIPQVKLVLTTPMPNFRHGSFNKNSAYAAEAIREVGTEMGISILDLYELVGAESGAKKLRKQGNYYYKDGIHFTQQGYIQQGKLLATAFLENCY